MATEDVPEGSVRSNLRRWLREPPSWLALFAAAGSLGSIVVSIGTSLYLNFYRGEVVVHLPTRIAFSIVADGAQFAVNASLVNAAPPNNLKIVDDAALELRLGDSPTPHKCEWRWTSELIPTAEYEQKHKRLYDELSEAHKQLVDQFAPPTRSAPFKIQGKELQSRTLIFHCPALDLPGAAETRIAVYVGVEAAGQPYWSAERVYVLTRRDVDTAREQKSWEWLKRPPQNLLGR
jgi:hypothetical protein